MKRTLYGLLCFFSCFYTLSGIAKAVEADPPVKVVPSKITLGSLVYGASKPEIVLKKVLLRLDPSEENLRITAVDLSKAPGIRLHEQKAKPGSRELLFEIDTGAFTRGQPFGKFQEGVIRLETNSEQYPQIVIPVIGWTSINDTSRDFNQFQFQGSHRWQGPWATPNIAGAVLVPLVLWILGGLGWVCHVLFYQAAKSLKGPKKGKSAAFAALLLAAAAVAVWLLFLLGHTYSRGSWVALLAGLAFFLPGTKALRFCGLGAASIFFAIILTLPAGVDRVGSYARVEEDKSIGNRLLLWEGALQAMAEHPVGGIGAGLYGEVFKRDYQTFDHTAANSTAVSDFMTFGAERGLLFLSLVTGLLLFLLYEALRSRDSFSLVAGSVLVSMMVSSLFSTLCFVFHYQILFFLSTGLLVFRIVSRIGNRAPDLQEAGKVAQQAALFVLAVFLGGSLLCAVALSRLPTRSSSFPNKANPESSAWLVVPVKVSVKGTILYMGNNQDELAVLAQSTLRPLSAKGWRVLWPGPVSRKEQLQEWIQQLRQTYPGQPLYLAGHGEGGKWAWLVASGEGATRIQRAAGCGFLAASDLLAEGPRVSFLVYQSLYDSRVSANASIRAKRAQGLEKVPLNIVLKAEILSLNSASWLEWMEALDSHFSQAPDSIR